tara:strand:- start:423 stop:860 length:438 start_codon:yes stop_codon:yes gene_type:complete
MEEAFWIVFAAVVAAVVGWGFGFLQAKKTGKTSSLAADLDLARKELREYQESANKHLNRTADLITDVYEKCHELQELTLSGSVRLNNDISRQSLLQPATYVHDRAEHDQKMALQHEKEVEETLKKNGSHSDELIVDIPPRDYAGK